MRHLLYILFALSTLTLASCKTDYTNLPTYTGSKQLQAVIEVPAGSSKPTKYNPQTQEFENVKLAGKDKVVEFLPYPANYGFIPSTEIDKDGSGLPILVLTGSLAPGTVMEVLPIAVLQLETAGEVNPIVVAVPARPSERTVNASSLAALTQKYPAAKAIIQQWFVNQDRTQNTKLVAWRDERFADKEILRWMKL